MYSHALHSVHCTCFILWLLSYVLNINKKRIKRKVQHWIHFQNLNGVLLSWNWKKSFSFGNFVSLDFLRPTCLISWFLFLRVILPTQAENILPALLEPAVKRERTTTTKKRKIMKWDILGLFWFLQPPYRREEIFGCVSSATACML